MAHGLEQFEWLLMCATVLAALSRVKLYAHSLRENGPL